MQTSSHHLHPSDHSLDTSLLPGLSPPTSQQRPHIIPKKGPIHILSPNRLRNPPHNDQPQSGTLCPSGGVSKRLPFQKALDAEIPTKKVEKETSKKFFSRPSSRRTPCGQDIFLCLIHFLLRKGKVNLLAFPAFS